MCTETGRRGGTSAGCARHHVLDLKLCNTEEDNSVRSLTAKTKYFGFHSCLWKRGRDQPPQVGRSSQSKTQQFTSEVKNCPFTSQMLVYGLEQEAEVPRESPPRQHPNETQKNLWSSGNSNLKPSCFEATLPNTAPPTPPNIKLIFKWNVKTLTPDWTSVHQVSKGGYSIMLIRQVLVCLVHGSPCFLHPK